VAEAMIYRHFASKEELFEAAILEPLEGLISQMLDRTEVMSLVDGRTRLAVATEIHQEICRAMVEILPLLGIALFSDADSGRLFWTERLAPLIDEAARATGEMRKGWEHSPIDPRLQFTAILGMYMGVAMDAHFRGDSVDCDEVGRELARFAAKGVQRLH
jgi:AcrR family transcriptional regulator